MEPQTKHRPLLQKKLGGHLQQTLLQRRMSLSQRRQWQRRLGLLLQRRQFERWQCQRSLGLLLQTTPLLRRQCPGEAGGDQEKEPPAQQKKSAPTVSDWFISMFFIFGFFWISFFCWFCATFSFPPVSELFHIFSVYLHMLSDCLVKAPALRLVATDLPFRNFSAH